MRTSKMSLKKSKSRSPDRVKMSMKRNSAVEVCSPPLIKPQSILKKVTFMNKSNLSLDIESINAAHD